MTTHRCKVIAHRGASRQKRENTVAAFTLAHELRADMVELDARRTRDNIVVVHHDAHLADGRAIVTVDALALPSHIPSLAEALDACVPMSVNVEIKNDANEADYDATNAHLDAIIDVMRAQRPCNELLVSSFNSSTIAAVREREPRLATALLTYTAQDAAQIARDAHAAGHRAWHPWDPTVTEAAVRDAHALGLAVNVWTVDDPDRMRELLRFGVDGICTNVPDIARCIVDAPE